MLAASNCVTLCVVPEQLANVRSAANVGLEGPLRALANQGLGERFHCWRGVSKQRYVFTVFASLEEAAVFADAIVIAVSRDRSGCRTAAWIGTTGAGGLSSANIAVLRCSRDACEWHVHLMAATPNARRNVMVDLNALLHLDDEAAIKCA